MPRSHPAPAVGKILELDGNVVGHVPRLKQPDLREMRLQIRDPVGELRHLEKFVVLLQIIGADPEQVRDQAAKTAQRHRRERQHRRRVFQARPRASARACRGRGSTTSASGRTPTSSATASSEQQNFFGAQVHWVPCAVANSRRLNSTMPNSAMMPPSSKTICANASPSSLQVMRAAGAQGVNRRKIFAPG